MNVMAMPMLMLKIAAFITTGRKDPTDGSLMSKSWERGMLLAECGCVDCQGWA